MAKVQFIKNISTLRLSKPENLMQVLLKNNIPVASSCGGDGICSKCCVKVLKGGDNLSCKNKNEQDCLTRNGIYDSKFRLSCQCSVLGDITVDTDYW